MRVIVRGAVKNILIGTRKGKYFPVPEWSSLPCGVPEWSFFNHVGHRCRAIGLGPCRPLDEFHGARCCSGELHALAPRLRDVGRLSVHRRPLSLVLVGCEHSWHKLWLRGRSLGGFRYRGQRKVLDKNRNLERFHMVRSRHCPGWPVLRSLRGRVPGEQLRQHARYRLRRSIRRL